VDGGGVGVSVCMHLNGAIFGFLFNFQQPQFKMNGDEQGSMQSSSSSSF
jgi:hypothetical protein